MASFDWGGTRILQKNTSLAGKRRVLGHQDVLVNTDLREWIVDGDREELRRVVETLNLPAARQTGTFDRRARIVWEWVAAEVKYVSDDTSQQILDFWQFPQETLALRQGDCEDSSFLLASLLLASGISPFCFRVVFGSVYREGGREAHAWPVYKDETGIWRVLESTLCPANLPEDWPAADVLARDGSEPRYVPDMGLNHLHVWQIREREIADVGEFVDRYMHHRKRAAKLPQNGRSQGGSGLA